MPAVNPCRRSSRPEQVPPPRCRCPQSRCSSSEFPFVPLRPDGVVVRQVHEARIATDHENCRGYGDTMSDETEPEAPEPDEIVDAEIVPIEPLATSEPLPTVVADTGYTAGG